MSALKKLLESGLANINTEELVEKLMNAKVHSRLPKKYDLFYGKKGREQYLKKVEEMIQEKNPSINIS